MKNWRVAKSLKLEEIKVCSSSYLYKETFIKNHSIDAEDNSLESVTITQSLSLSTYLINCVLNNIVFVFKQLSLCLVLPPLILKYFTFAKSIDLQLS